MAIANLTLDYVSTDAMNEILKQLNETIAKLNDRILVLERCAHKHEQMVGGQDEPT